MIEKAIRQRARLGMGDTIKGYAKGGTIGIDVAKPVNVTAPRGKTGLGLNPLTVAKRNNGVPGMKKGGYVK